MTEIALTYDEAVRIPPGVVDLDSFRRWAHSDDFPERGKITWVRGEIIVDMSPEEISSHNKVRRDVQHYLGELLEENDIGELLPDGAMFVNELADVSNEPDLTFCSWDGLRSGRVAYREWVDGSERFVEVIGSPDMVMDVVSRSSARKDKVMLRTSYFEAGVQEYWLIDARRREIEFELLTRSEVEFVPVEPDADGFRASAVFGCSFRLRRGTNPVGGARYDLEVGPEDRQEFAIR